MSGLAAAAERGGMIVAQYEGIGDVVSILADIDAYCLSEGMQPVTTLAVYAHQVTERRQADAAGEIGVGF